MELHVSDEASKKASCTLAVLSESIGDAHGRSLGDDSVDEPILGALAQLVGQGSAGDAGEQISQFVEAAISSDVECCENLDGPTAREHLERFDRGLDLPGYIVCITRVLGEDLADSRPHPLARDDAGFNLFQALRG